MSQINVALVYRPGKALTGVTTYAELLNKALAGFAQTQMLPESPSAGFDLIHILDAKSARPKDLRDKGVPVLVDLHDYYWAEYQFFFSPDLPLRWLTQKFRKRHYSKILKSASAVVVHSRAVASYVNHPKIFMVPIGIEFEEFQADPTQRREPVILLVGRDAWRKGLWTLVSAVRKLKRDFPELKVEVIGKEYPHARFFGRVLSTGLEVNFRGEMGRPELIRQYQNAMMVYLGSWMEGFGLSLLEGMSAGCVAIGSNAGGIPETFEDGESGILFNPGDTMELTFKMRALLESEELREKFAIMGQRRAKELFSLERMRESVLKAYQEALNLAR